MKLLFICTHNRCRSILAEAVTNHLSDGSLQAKSAGSQPAGEVHPLSLKYLSDAGISTDGLLSQSWDAYESWKPDVVITVCDSAAGEQCPVWFGSAIRAHWGLVDPSRMEGRSEDIAQAFRRTIDMLSRRVRMLLDASADQLSQPELSTLLEQLSEQ